jgi:hypothetical protein
LQHPVTCNLTLELHDMTDMADMTSSKLYRSQGC